ncbi:DH domain-containing protein [Pseudozyma hubeiensis]|nr:DH domain-containing protein [Pseudozyma hubeiensis]
MLDRNQVEPAPPQRFTLPLAPTSHQFRASSILQGAYPPRNSFSRPLSPLPAASGHQFPQHYDKTHRESDSSISSGSSTCQSSFHPAPATVAPFHRTLAHSTRSPSFASISQIMMAAPPIDRLPPLGAAGGMHSPFSIPHTLFGNDAAPSSSSYSSSLPRSPLASTSESRPLPPLSHDRGALKTAALLDALAGPSSGMQPSSSSHSLTETDPFNLDLSQNAGSTLSASGSFGGNGAYSSTNGNSFGQPGSSSGAGAGSTDRNGSQRSSGAGDGNDAGGNGDDGSKDASEKDKAKKTNPLVDLLETEAAYVSELSKIIKKVAAAWSRSNFPPPELDTMFRNVEAIYRANRGFLKALKEIGPNPSSPKALGDLLMKWIDDLEAPYTRFCEGYLADFDAWSTVQSNPRLAKLLQEISGATDAEGRAVVFSDRKRDPTELWTLDALFALPHIRLKYYKKLYSRLLKSTQPGRSDHRLLVGANEKLDELVDKSRRRLAVSVLDEAAGRESRDSSFAESNVTSENSPRDRVSSATSASESQSPSVQPVQSFGNKSSPPRISAAEPSNGASTGSAASTIRAPTPAGMPLLGAPPTAQLNGLSLDQPTLTSSRPDLIRGNSEVASVHDSASQTATDTAASSRTNSLSQPIELLEKRLDTSRTLDIFTMKPKKCQLQMNPPGIPFARSMRKSADVVIHFTPSSGGPEVTIRRAHMFLLTDLFLVCERMTPSEKAELSSGGVGPDMWLLYPPLAGKHLRVADMGGQGNVLSITILKKERLIVHTDSREAKEDWLEHFADCQKFAANMGLKLKTGASTLAAPPAGGSVTSGATLASGAPSLTTPALSPAISITPSSLNGHDEAGHASSAPFSPEADNSPVIGSDLSRQASFNSVASFPKVPALGSPDLGTLPHGSHPGFSPRAPSPSQFGPGGGPGGPRGPPMARPGMMSPTNGTLSPDTSPAPGFGPMHVRPGMGPPPPPGMGPGGSAFMNGAPRSPMGRPPPGGPSWAPGPPRPPPNGIGAREAMRRPSAPNLRQPSHSSSGEGRTSDEVDGGGRSFIRTRSVSSTGSTAPKLPSAMMKEGRDRGERGTDVSPPSSPVQKRQGPFRSTVSAQMRCKLFLKQGHAQWKSLGNARLKLFHILPDDIRQLVVENDRKTLISTIVLTDGVERVGKVGVAVELSDQGNRTGIIYMLQMRSEESASGLFGQLLEGSDRTAAAISMGGSLA